MNQIPADPAAVYGKEYYDRMCAVAYDRDQPVWQKHFQNLARALIERYRPRTVLDVGCAKGFLVEHLRDDGVEAFGTDVSPYAISQVREDVRPHCRVASGTEPLSGRFDLITCIEVAEHMPEADARTMIAEICRHTEHVIFSSTDSDFSEPTHINIHPADYWIDLFRQQGFFPDRNFQPEFITPQAMRFLRCLKPALHVGVFSHEPPNCAVALLRLAGTIRHLERQNRMQLQWCTARDPRMDIEKLIDSDLFVLHREFCDQRICPQVMAAARELGRPVVFELDDLLINVPETNPNHNYCTAIAPDVLAMLRDADFVTVTTEPLRRYLEEAEPRARGKTHVLPNYINLDIWDGAVPPPEKLSEPFVIGWFGTATHDEDLAIVKPAIVQLARKYAGKLVFKFWGYLPKDLEGIPGVQLMRGSQPDLRLHARDVVNSRIDLALAPLLDHPFNHAKSDLKWLEYSICYIPAIYSTISPYTGSVDHGRTGWLVDNQPEQWVEAIERFMHDHQLRRSIAIQAHDAVRQKRCVNVGAEKWDALYRSFHVSGPKPRAVAVETISPPRDRAAAHIMLHAANALFAKGENEQAAKLCEQAVPKCVPAESAQGRLVRAILEHYRNVLKNLNQISELTARLNAARTVADAGQNHSAVQLYLQTLQLAQQSDNPLTVLKVILEVARAFPALDPARGRSLLDLGAQLAKSIRSQSALQTIEQLRAEYLRKSPAPKPGGKSKPPRKATPPLKSAAPVPAAAMMGNTPAVSIIIPTFNNLPLTRSCLESLAKTPATTQFETIVVDNASTDGSAEFLREQEKAGGIRLIINLRNEGFARACNQGAQAAHGSRLLFLNNDTKVTPGWLDAMIQAARRPHVGIVGAKLLYADGRIQHAGIGFINDIPDHPHRHAPADAAEANQFRELDMVTGACLLIQRELFIQLAGFDETYRNGVEDIDLCLRARAAGRKIVYEPRAVVYHLEGQSAGRFSHVNENLRLFFGRWGKSFDARKNFVVTRPVRIVTASRSLLLASAEQIPVTWIGSFLDHGSLSQVNRELTAALQTSPGVRLQRVSNGAAAAPGCAAAG